MVVRVPTAPPASGRRRWIIILVAVVAGLVLAFTALSGFFVDVLWFREVRLSDVFWTVLRTKVLLGLAFGLAFFVLLYSNLWIVRRITPRYHALTPDQEIIERYRMQFEPYARWLLPLFALVIALFVGLGVTGQWQTYLLWRNGAGLSFGNPEPVFGRDPAFYVFSLPWLKFMQGWLFSALVGVTLLTALAHYLWGGIRPQAPGFGEKVSPQVKAHLSVLLGLIMLTKAWGYYLGQFDLLTSTRGVVVGASYTDVNAQLPALRILVIIAIACAILFLVNIRLRGWALPVIAVGLLALVSIIAGAAYPAFVQRFRVAPQEFQREQPYIEDNIEATRRAFSLDNITSSSRPLGEAVTAEAAQANAPTISNIRLWRPDVLGENYTSLQRFRSYYEFNDVDVDRYVVDGERRVLMLSTREVSQGGIPEGGQTWQNVHLVYTHGFGAVASQVNTSTTEGQPEFTLRDIPPVGDPPLPPGNGQRVYYGEGAQGDAAFVVVDTGTEELDFQGTATDDQAQETFTYDGDGGIPIGGFFQRALFAWRFRDVNLLISDLIQGESRIMIYRHITERVPKPAPFLKFDDDPYTAVIDGRLVWIWDAYTITNQYPYSDFVDLTEVAAAANQTSSITGDINYLRNSVKVVVDAYTGKMTYYVADPNDPIIEAWDKAFPTMFTPLDQASPAMLEHFRYPENLFQVQAFQYTNYHVTNPNVFYGKQDFWALPQDPTVQIETETGTTASRLMRPYYVLMRLPGEAEESFVLILPFTPLDRQNMIAWLAAKSDPGPDYGDIVSFEFPSGVNVDGPTQVFSRINQDARFSAERTLLGQGGSTIVFGDFLVIPLQDSLLYVQPVYVKSNQENAIPELKRVVVANGTQIGIGTSLREALNDSIGAVVPQPGGGGGGGVPPEGSTEQQIQSLLDQATQHFAAADAALRAGDLARYQREIAAAQEATAQAQELIAQLLGAEGSATASPSPTPSASPSPSP
jgi:uncharacterized membrane protein (UPF0182 family)